MSAVNDFEIKGTVIDKPVENYFDKSFSSGNQLRTNRRLGFRIFNFMAGLTGNEIELPEEDEGHWSNL